MQEKNTIQLPKTTKEGKPRISYSQCNLWKESSSFNMGTEGWIEYICQYFLGFSFEDKGWAEFGHDVEDYITKRDKESKFNDKEKYTLDKIETLGVFQKEIEVDFGDFILLVIIDDMLENMSRIRDYKTGSSNSCERYRKDDYCQMDVYALAIFKKFGIMPEAEVCAIERKGNCMFGGGRKALTVGDQIWYIPREITEERLEWLENDIRETVQEISENFKVFKKINAV